MFSLPIPSQLQLDHAKWMAEEKIAGDFSAPGTGKTITGLTAAGIVGGPVIVVCPPIAVHMWAAALATYFNTDDVAIVTSKRDFEFAAIAEHVVVTYGLAGHALPYLRKRKHKLRVALLDEAQYLKNVDSQRTAAIYGRRAMAGPDALIHGIEAVFPLTGTPVTRYADDLFPHLKALRPDLLAPLGATSLEAFQKIFCVTQLKSFHKHQRPKPVVTASRNIEVLRELLYGSYHGSRKFAVRRRLEDMLETVPQLDLRPIDVALEWSQEFKDATAAMEGDYEQEGPGSATVRRLLGTAKAKAGSKFVLDWQEDLRRPVLVLYWHKEVGDAYEAALRAKKKRIVRVDGSTTAAGKASAQHVFNEHGVDFLLGQIQAMGVSLNLQKGSNFAVQVERDWSPANEEQAFARLLRMGQEQHVVAYQLLSDHPMDSAAVNVNSRKQKEQAQLNRKVT